MKNLTKTSIAASVFLAISSISSNAFGQSETDVDALVKQAEKVAYYSGNDGRSDARMMIVDPQGRKQMRQFTILRRDIEDNGDQQMMVFFARPSDVKDTVLRVEKKTDVNVEDDRWLYLPALDLVKRISAGDKRTSFVGSHFYYEDVSGRAITEDVFSLHSDSDKQVTLKAQPIDKTSVEFDYYLVSIDKATLLPVLIDFFKQGDDNYRRVEAVKIEEIQGIPTVVRSKVSDLKTGGYTLMEFRNIQYDIGLEKNIFSERSLRNPPRQWLK